jgi:hypothetical protein
MTEWDDVPKLRSLIEKWAAEGASREEIVARLQRMAERDPSGDLPRTDEPER